MKDLTMQMAKCQRMTAHIYFRTTKAELARLNRAAKVLGITRSAMIRAAAEARANRIIGLNK